MSLEQNVTSPSFSDIHELTNQINSALRTETSEGIIASFEEIFQKLKEGEQKAKDKGAEEETLAAISLWRVMERHYSYLAAQVAIFIKIFSIN